MFSTACLCLLRQLAGELQAGMSRFWLLLWLLFGLLLGGLAAVQGEVIALALPFLAYLAVSVLNAPREANLLVNRTLNEDGDLAVQVTIEHPVGSLPVDESVIQDAGPPELRLLDGSSQCIVSMAPGDQVVLNYTLQRERGWHYFEGVKVVLREHFNIIERRLFLSCQDEVHTLPTYPRLRRLAVNPAHTRGFAGPIASRQSGVGMIFWGAREYQLGDSLHRINWKISSRHSAHSAGWERLVSNEFEQERIADVGLILDARDRVNLRAGDHSLFERSVSAAAALAEVFLADGHRVSLLTYGYGMQRVYPGSGKVHKARILKALAQVKPGSNEALESFRHLPTRLFSPRSLLVIISPLAVNDIEVYERLRSTGYSVLLISPDPLELERQHLRQDLERVSLAERLTKLERQLLLSRLRALRVIVVNWPVNKTLEEVLATEYTRQENNRLRGMAVSGRLGQV